MTSQITHRGTAFPPMPVKVSPYRHQQEAYEFVLSVYAQKTYRHGAGLLMEMGTGKTLTAIAVAGTLYKDLKINRLLIVAPLSIVGVWKEEFAKFADFPYTLLVIEGKDMKTKTELLWGFHGDGLEIAVINYESAWRMEEALSDWTPDMIIADEGHKLKSYRSNISKAMHRLGDSARYKLLLTGTPITNKEIDIWSQYRFTDSSIYGTSFFPFRTRFFYMTGYGNHTPVLRKDMLPEFAQRMHSIAYRARKADCLDLPETTDIVRRFPLEAQARKIYDDLVEESYAKLIRGEVTAPNVLTQMLRLSQSTGGFLCADESKSAQQISTVKLDMLSDIMDSALQEGQKLVIICHFRAELEAIQKLVESKGVGYSIVAGGVKDREEQVSRFQNDPATVVFIGQIATAGLGITLTAASTMVFYSLDYSMSNFEQAKARIHRSGQKFPCTYLYLVAENTIDEKVLKALKDKADLAKTLVDDFRRGMNPFR